MDKKSREELKTQAPKEPEVGIEATGAYPDVNKAFPGDSVEEHKSIEQANHALGREEIKQQNDNL